MFTGLVQALGKVVERAQLEGGGARLTIQHGLGPLEMGESVAVDGACLTVVADQPEPSGQRNWVAELSAETLARTTLGALDVGQDVNLERSLRAGDRLGGHLVSGHVDGTARVVALEAEGDMTRVTWEVSAPLARYVAEKGSVTLAGVSLTVNGVDEQRFWLQLIPHTRAVTTLGRLEVGSVVNFEVDLLARYVERLLTTQR